VVVLVEPQLGENIGAAARAMLNFGLTEMRIVKPRDGWPNYKAINTASGAHAILDEAKIFDTTEDAIADLHAVYATTARVRDMVKPVLTPRDAAGSLKTAISDGRRCGILFGQEKFGLSNEDVALADSLIIVPTNPDYSSINLAQAVLLTSYEWFQAGAPGKIEDLTRKAAQPATRRELHDFFDHLESELDECGFLHPPEKRPRMVRNIRNIFTRANLTDQEVRTLRGIIVGLTRAWMFRKEKAEEKKAG
jgi:tRNA/rRNA methyltransferase